MLPHCLVHRSLAEDAIDLPSYKHQGTVVDVIMMFIGWAAHCPKDRGVDQNVCRHHSCRWLNGSLWPISLIALCHMLGEVICEETIHPGYHACRVCIVNNFGTVLLDKFVRPGERVTGLGGPETLRSRILGSSPRSRRLM